LDREVFILKGQKESLVQELSGRAQGENVFREQLVQVLERRISAQ